MNLEERQKYILEKVNSSGKVITSKLSKDLQTSRETIRKDLYTLDQQQKLIAVRGGAVSISNNIITETIYNKRISQNIIQKDEIANKALSLIKNNQIVYLDNGSSIVELAKKIRTSNLKNLTIITSSLVQVILKT
jgi:DeoR/GlpR family transcriptional regulator of sugar metabolism